MNITRNLTINAIITSILLLPVSLHAATVVDDGLDKAASVVSKAITDSSITTKIKSLLVLESDIKSFDIAVTTKEHIVYLAGTVDTMLQADRAIQLAQSVSGVKDVDTDKLKVKESANYTSDALITAKVKGSIVQLSNDAKINSKNDLHVETTNGVVHIFGSVANGADAATIKNTVSAVKGVKSVNTNIDTKN